MRRWAAVAMLVAWAFVRASSVAPTTRRPGPPPTTVVTLERCAERFLDGRCVLPTDRAVVVTSSPARALTVLLDGAQVGTSSVASAERLVVVGAGAARLEVWWRGERLRAAQLLAPDTPAPGRGALERARAARRAGEDALAAEELGRAIDEAAAAGAQSVELSARIVLAYSRFERFELEEAQRVLAPVGPLGDEWIEGEALRRLQLGILHDAALQLPEAAEDLLASARAARRVRDALARDQSSLARDGLHQLALLYARVGRLKEAWAALREVEALLPAEASCDERADLLGNLGFVGVAAHEAGFADVTTDLPALAALHAQAVDLAARCPVSPRDLAILRANFARSALLRGHLEEAEGARALAQQALVPSDAELRADLLELESAIAQAAGHTETASAATRELLALATARSRPDLAWRAHLRRGRTAEALGELDAAAAAYAAAEAAVSEEVSLIALAQGALSVPYLRSASAARWISLELTRGRPDEALRVARASIRRGLLSALIRERLLRTDGPALQALRAEFREAEALAEAWSDNTEAGRDARRRTLRATDRARALAGPHLTALPLAELTDGEVLLTWFPLESGWVGFAFDGRAVEVATLGPMPRADDAAALATWALTPLWPVVERAQRVRLQPTRELSAVDLHAQVVHGRRLIDAAEVVYGLDLPRAEPHREGAPTWLFGVGDPSIPEVEREISTLRARLPGAHARVGAEATAARLTAALAEADHLHFAGHARFTGLDGLGSYLVLADGRVHLGDLLWSERVPRTAVLSACESAGTASLAGSTAIGLAQALALMGSAWVVAPTRPVHDRLAGSFAERLYAHGLPVDAADVVRRAQRDLSSDGRPELRDWAAYRVIVP